MGGNDSVNTAAEKRAGRSFWDANPCGGSWSDYRRFAEWVERTEPYAFRVLDEHEWNGLRVLEVGCGQGVVLNRLPRMGARAVGVDMSPGSVGRARAGARAFAHADRIHVAVADAERLPFADASFDAVVSFGVLHHTPDTAAAVGEVRRVLRPGGTAIVMLYRTGNPKWWATRAARTIASAVDRIRGEAGALANRLRPRHGADDARGTALLELFGVPTLHAFSNGSAIAMFGGFASATIRNMQPGFRRLADISPLLRPTIPWLDWIDRRFETAWGFYQVIEARR